MPLAFSILNVSNPSKYVLNGIVIRKKDPEFMQLEEIFLYCVAVREWLRAWVGGCSKREGGDGGVLCVKRRDRVVAVRK